MECAFYCVPTVAIYKSSWANYEIAKRIVKVKYLAMPNLLANEEIFPEFIQQAATVEKVVDIERPGDGRPIRPVDRVCGVDRFEHEAVALAECRIGRLELCAEVRDLAIEAAHSVEALEEPAGGAIPRWRLVPVLIGGRRGRRDARPNGRRRRDSSRRRQPGVVRRRPGRVVGDEYREARADAQRQPGRE